MRESVSGGRTHHSCDRWYGRNFWILFAIALAVRLLLITVSQFADHGAVGHPAEYSDCGVYMRYGLLFANGLDTRDAIPADRDRLLPFVLGMIFRITGRSVVAAQLTCALSAVLGLLLLYPLARTTLSPRLSLLACGLWTLDPSFVGQSCLPLTANLATPLIVGSLLALVQARRRRSTGLILLSAFVLVVAFHARASAFALSAPVVLWLLGWPASWRRRAAWAAMYTAAMTAGWLSSSYVSYRLCGVFTPNTHTYRLWGHAAAKLMVQTGQAATIDEAKQHRRQYVQSHLPPDATWTDYLEAKRASDMAYVRRHPWMQLRNHAQALLATTLMPDRWSIPALLGVHRAGGIWHQPIGLVAKARLAIKRWGPIVIVHATAHGLYTLVLWSGVVLAVPDVRDPRRRAIVALLLLTIAAVMAGGAINVEATPRYRLPGIPMMAVLAAVGVDRWTQRRRHRGRVFNEHDLASGDSPF